MRTLKTLVVVSFALASLFLTYNLIALDSDVGAGIGTWGGVFVWGFESWNTIDLHTGATDIAESEHYMSITNQRNTELAYDWKVRFWVPPFGNRFEYTDSGSGIVQPGATFDDSRSGSIDVGVLRPGWITLKGYSELNAGRDTWFAEDVHREYLHNPHH